MVARGAGWARAHPSGEWFTAHFSQSVAGLGLDQTKTRSGALGDLASRTGSSSRKIEEVRKPPPIAAGSDKSGEKCRPGPHFLQPATGLSLGKGKVPSRGPAALGLRRDYPSRRIDEALRAGATGRGKRLLRVARARAVATAGQSPCPWRRRRRALCWRHDAFAGHRSRRHQDRDHRSR